METEATNNNLAHEPKLIDEFQDASEELNNAEEDSSDEEFYDISPDFDSFMDRLVEKRRKLLFD